MGDDQLTTQKVLAGLSTHPNAGAVLILGLGCENNNIGVFKQFLNLDDDRLYFLNSQEVDDEFAEGKKLVDEILEKINKFEREDA